MKIEAVVVCKNYADFLEHTLPMNMNYLDRIVVVTHPDDKRTQALCNKFSVDFLDTTEMHRDGDKFNKGRAINLGLSHLRHDGWLLHLDADIVLPHNFRGLLAQSHLDTKKIYGADRLNVVGADLWHEHKDDIVPLHRYRYLITPTEEFPLGSRLLHKEYGYCPIGYFQMWHSSARRRYPIVSGSAENDDVLFAVQWPRERREVLPELFVYHLESEKAKMGANWDGRTTQEFRRHHRHHHRHHHHHHHRPYRPWSSDDHA